MIGREVFKQPWLLAELEMHLSQEKPYLQTRSEVLQRYSCYIENELRLGVSAHLLVRPLSGLFHGMAGAKYWRRMLSEAVQNREKKLDDLPGLGAGFEL